MSPTREARQAGITENFVQEVCARIVLNKRTRRALPGGGRYHVDRALPFVCIYRRPSTVDDLGTAELVTTEASYVLASGARSKHADLCRLLGAVADTIRDQFGSVLFLEVWSGSLVPSPLPNDGVVPTAPAFRIHLPRGDALGRFADTFEEALSRIALQGARASVDQVSAGRVHPPRMARCLLGEGGVFTIGLEVRPVYRNPDTGDTYPAILRALRRQLSRALRRSIYRFVNQHTSHRPAHFEALGHCAIRKVVLDIDHELTEVSKGFDFLLQVTPTNAPQAWRSFQKDRYRRPPLFRYRPCPIEPALLKRSLFSIRLERIEDPAMEQLMYEKTDELDRQITMLGDIDTPRFVHGSIQLYGGVEDELHKKALATLERLPKRSRENRGARVDAKAFAERARSEIDYYRNQWDNVDAKVHVRPDLSNGLMVSRGSLLIGHETVIPASRVDALLQHEVGTHVLTYYNGLAQPLRLLSSGLAGYEALQEGVAVLSEYLVGGLSSSRLRLLAARVIAVRTMLSGASFVDTFSELVDAYAFELRTAFTITLRVFRGGGLTKDAVYLRGLLQVLEHLKKGGVLEPMMLGKMSIGHIPIVKELQRRGVLQEPPLKPRYFDIPMVRERLRRIRNEFDLIDLTRSK